MERPPQRRGAAPYNFRKRHEFSINAKRYFRETNDLGPKMSLAYLHLRMMAWVGGGCTFEDRTLHARLRLTKEEWEWCRPRLRRYFNYSEGWWWHPEDIARYERWEAAREQRKKKREASQPAAVKPEAPPPPKPEPKEPPKEPPAPHYREQLLEAMGIDPNGAITPTGRIMGGQADMAEARRWCDELGLSVERQLAVIRGIMERKGSAPQSFKYFTRAMQEEAGRKPLEPVAAATGRPQGGGRTTEAEPSGRPDYEGIRRREAIGVIETDFQMLAHARKVGDAKPDELPDWVEGHRKTLRKLDVDPDEMMRRYGLID